MKKAGVMCGSFSFVYYNGNIVDFVCCRSCQIVPFRYSQERSRRFGFYIFNRLEIARNHTEPNQENTVIAERYTSNSWRNGHEKCSVRRYIIVTHNAQIIFLINCLARWKESIEHHTTKIEINCHHNLNF
ncbi:uncharacterized protein LOC127011720 isoform X2 [Drosophila biarmipes]|uniref:uncharacterized protein LOC127011720 isoform X1 n=1 Tax=Drosophila biarmipes TaxID=125945 RepID=UPI0021CC5BB4|nr:uncharacterized protein LOC127011720 isoform X1 [Drosophila biarmipes]XP_050745743.1 uncharacterized protein LOC127011720 isoform X2 [Drosophila biarmipes]